MMAVDLPERGMPRKLPVLAILRATYGSIRAHSDALPTLARGTAMVAAVAAALSVASVQLILSDEQEAAAFLASPPGERAAAYTSLASFVVLLGLFLIIVRWHRMIVRDVAAAETRRKVAGAAVLYFARGVLVTWIGVTIALIVGLLPLTWARDLGMPSDVRWVFSIGWIAAVIIGALLIVGRLSLILPAGAVGDYHVTMSRAWELSRGNGWRILTGSILASGPAVLANFALNGLMDALPTTNASVPALVAALVLSLLLFVVTAIVQASFLSYAYRFLAGDHIVQTPLALER